MVHPKRPRCHAHSARRPSRRIRLAAEAPEGRRGDGEARRPAGGRRGASGEALGHGRHGPNAMGADGGASGAACERRAGREAKHCERPARDATCGGKCVTKAHVETCPKPHSSPPAPARAAPTTRRSEQLHNESRMAPQQGTHPRLKYSAQSPRVIGVERRVGRPKPRHSSDARAPRERNDAQRTLIDRGAATCARGTGQMIALTRAPKAPACVTARCQNLRCSQRGPALQGKRAQRTRNAELL